VPSQTELLHYLKLNEEVVGITKFCIHPNEWFSSKTRIGGTKNINIEKVTQLKPDLIIGNKEENTLSDIKALEKIAPVWISDVNSFEDALDMIKHIGIITEKKSNADQLTDKLSMLQNKNYTSGQTAVYLIWNDPMMSAGKNTFIDSMMGQAGLINLIQNERYPEIDIEKINQLKPNLLLLSTEPYPFNNKHLASLQTQLTNTKTLLVDGEMFSWYGSRLLKSFAYFEEIFKI
jgi:ABC-type Fe3+-hydroxamate transport system substrate-binding protein